MNEDEILARLSGIIGDWIGVDDLKLTRDSTADQYEGWDSMMHLNIVTAVEQDFGVRFKTAELEHLRNVGEFVDVIKHKLAA